MKASTNLDIELAMHDDYRVIVHAKFFPYKSTDPESPGDVHAAVDHGARAIFCSQEYFDKLKQVAS